MFRSPQIGTISQATVVHGSILCDPIQPSPSTGGPNPTQPNPTQPNPTQPNPIQSNPTQPNGTMEQCCSQGQNPKTKDEAKARTLKAEAKAWTLETKTKIPHIVAAMMRLLAATWRTEYDIAAEAQRI